MVYPCARLPRCQAGVLPPFDARLSFRGSDRVRNLRNGESSALPGGAGFACLYDTYRRPSPMRGVSEPDDFLHRPSGRQREHVPRDRHAGDKRLSDADREHVEDVEPLAVTAEAHPVMLPVEEEVVLGRVVAACGVNGKRVTADLGRVHLVDARLHSDARSAVPRRSVAKRSASSSMSDRSS